ncbi:unnamed protein product [Prorocentrum cordatum]|uniref:3-hydroxyisobutyrate dehydrogenase n=1 Tax=Prorocentrum cordatum TaxID=2364126 RepID=A0ABN9VJN0_9DINO|nr:unnamed protein product [Polarella glacialis]
MYQNLPCAFSSPEAAGACIVSCTSGEPRVTRRLAGDLLARFGVHFLDCPVSGGPRGAAAGSLTCMLGADCEEAAGRATPVIQAFAKRIVRCGPAGAGHAVKAVNNALNVAHLLLGAEGLLALQGAGVKPEVALDAINSSSGRSLLDTGAPAPGGAHRLLQLRFQAAPDGEGLPHRRRRPAGALPGGVAAAAHGGPGAAGRGGGGRRRRLHARGPAARARRGAAAAGQHIGVQRDTTSSGRLDSGAPSRGYAVARIRRRANLSKRRIRKRSISWICARPPWRRLWRRPWRASRAWEGGPARVPEIRADRSTSVLVPSLASPGKARIRAEARAFALPSPPLYSEAARLPSLSLARRGKL